jgi:hypothetical protein
VIVAQLPATLDVLGEGGRANSANMRKNIKTIKGLSRSHLLRTTSLDREQKREQITLRSQQMFAVVRAVRKPLRNAESRRDPGRNGPVRGVRAEFQRYEAGGADENAHEGKPWADDPAEAHNWARTCEHPGCTNEAAVWGPGGSWCSEHFDFERYQ